MRSFSFTLLAACSLAAAPLSACAMNAPVPSVPLCRVTGAELLPSGIGGAPAICGEMEQAVAAAGASGTTIEVRVENSSLLSATAKLPDGRTLPAVKVGVSDRELSASSVRRLAQALAEQIRTSQR